MSVETPADKQLPSAAAADEGARWNLRHWVLGIVLTLALQGLLVVFLSRDKSPSPARTPVEITAGLIADPDETRAWQSQLALRSPTLFAVVDPKSFSGEAWLNRWRDEYQFPKWTEPARWLAYRSPSPGETEMEAAVEAAALPKLATANPPPSPGVRVSLGEGLITRPTVEIVGEASVRYQQREVDLPVWAHSEILSNSTVDVLVNGAGDTVSARLVLPGCGLKAADEYAVQWARQARYRPGPAAGEGPSADLAGATITIHWCTQGVTATNRPGPLRLP